MSRPVKQGTTTIHYIFSACNYTWKRTGLYSPAYLKVFGTFLGSIDDRTLENSSNSLCLQIDTLQARNLNFT